MAWFDSSKNGGYSTYRRIEPGYGGMGYSDGREHYSHNSQNYVAKSEQVVEYRRVPDNMTDHKYGPPRKEVYKDNGVGDNSPPSRDQYYTSHDYGKHNNLNSKTNHKYDDSDEDDDDGFEDDDDSDEDDDDDVICNDGGCFEKPKEGSKPNYFKKEDYNENERHKGNGYTLPTYTVPISTQPQRDTYNVQSNIFNYKTDQREKGNSYGPPRNELEKRLTMKHPTISQESIDSTEARRRYGKAPPGTWGHAKEKYTRTIENKEAAKKYSGVFLPN